MASLADLERLFERVFERSTARLFRTRVQAVQLERRVERAMELARAVDRGRTTVPDRYRVRMCPSDLGAAASDMDGAEALAARLADAALAFARGHGYHLRGRPTVWLVADPSLAAGQVEVDPVAEAHGRPTASAAPAPPTDAADARPAGAPEAPPAEAAPTPMPVVAALDIPAEGPGGPGSIRSGDGTQTLVFRRPAPDPTRAILREIARDGRERTIEVDGTVLTIGRARDNGLVLDDPRASRHHGRLQARRGALVYTDLGSTNGSRVNGIRVDEIVLGAGDRLEIGDTVLVVELLPG